MPGSHLGLRDVVVKKKKKKILSLTPRTLLEDVAEAQISGQLKCSLISRTIKAE